MGNTKIAIGGDRLGSGNKRDIALHGYERSTHDIGYTWRSTMASGTLVPFMNELALNGDTFDIDLECDIMTNPTIGPLFGSYKVQLDVFSAPLRLYQAKLMMNMEGIGMEMHNVKFPQILMTADGRRIYDTEQINPSSLYSYLGIRGLGKGGAIVARRFNANSILAYWDTYYNYYSNKQEGIGAVIHDSRNEKVNDIVMFDGVSASGPRYLTEDRTSEPYVIDLNVYDWNIGFNGTSEPVIKEIKVKIGDEDSEPIPIDRIWDNIVWTAGVAGGGVLAVDNVKTEWGGEQKLWWYTYNGDVVGGATPQIETFSLDNINKVKRAILAHVNNGNAFEINDATVAPYGLGLQEGTYGYSKLSPMEGLGLKTYQSDIYNNWVSKEFIDGGAGVNEISAVDTSSGSFTMDTLNLAKKVYELFNRIAISGGTYNDWQQAVYKHSPAMQINTPVYHGGLSKELGFQEVVSNASAVGNDNTNQPLGTLAGRGKMTSKNKGGKVRVRTDEASIVYGIISLTPRLDYSQGNKWINNIETMNDLHKPQMDGIGFEHLLTDGMAWWDTDIDLAGVVKYRSAGFVPAWTNYMTNVNQVYGNFAEEFDQMFMVLTRRYERDDYGNILDLTTYVDPSKFNYIFANTRLDAQNFWTQIKVNIIKRSIMSAKQMPNM